MSTPEEWTSPRANRGGRAFWVIPALAFCVAALVGIGSCFYAPPAWYRRVEQMRLRPEERRFALLMRSSLQMHPRGPAMFLGIPITLREQCDVWVCDPQGRFARRVAAIRRPSWIGAGFNVWMIDWQSHGGRSSLYLSVSGRRWGISDALVGQHVRVDFDRNTADHSSSAILGPPRSDVQHVQDFVNPPNEYGIMSVQQQGDTLSVWTDRLPDWRARFVTDNSNRSVRMLGFIPRRSKPGPDPARIASNYDNVCPGHIRGVPSPTMSRIAFGETGHPVVTAAIIRVDASCAQRRHPNVGSEEDGEIEFPIAVSAWIDYEIKDAEWFQKSGESYEAEVIFEAVSANSTLLGSTSMGFVPSPGSPGIKSASLNCEIAGMKPEAVSRVARVVAHWDRRSRER